MQTAARPEITQIVPLKICRHDPSDPGRLGWWDVQVTLTARYNGFLDGPRGAMETILVAAHDVKDRLDGYNVEAFLRCSTDDGITVLIGEICGRVSSDVDWEVEIEATRA